MRSKSVQKVNPNLRETLSGSQGTNFTAGGREHFANRPREAGDSVLVKTERSEIRDPGAHLDYERTPSLRQKVESPAIFQPQSVYSRVIEARNRCRKGRRRHPHAQRADKLPPMARPDFQLLEQRRYRAEVSRKVCANNSPP